VFILYIDAKIGSYLENKSKVGDELRNAGGRDCKIYNVFPSKLELCRKSAKAKNAKKKLQELQWKEKGEEISHRKAERRG
jgi:hypothetical protein